MHLILINACVGVELQGLRVSKCLQSSFFFISLSWLLFSHFQFCHGWFLFDSFIFLCTFSFPLSSTTHTLTQWTFVFTMLAQNPLYNNAKDMTFTLAIHSQSVMTNDHYTCGNYPTTRWTIIVGNEFLKFRKCSTNNSKIVRNYFSSFFLQNRDGNKGRSKCW